MGGDIVCGFSEAVQIGAKYRTANIIAGPFTGKTVAHDSGSVLIILTDPGFRDNGSEQVSRGIVPASFTGRVNKYHTSAEGGGNPGKTCGIRKAFGFFQGLFVLFKYK